MSLLMCACVYDPEFCRHETKGWGGGLKDYHLGCMEREGGEIPRENFVEFWPLKSYTHQILVVSGDTKFLIGLVFLIILTSVSSLH